MNKTENTALSSIAPCVKSHCHREQSAESGSGGEVEGKDSPYRKSLETME